MRARARARRKNLFDSTVEGFTGVIPGGFDDNYCSFNFVCVIIVKSTLQVCTLYIS